jgi:hypothetical protein
MLIQNVVDTTSLGTNIRLNQEQNYAEPAFSDLSVSIGSVDADEA